MADFTVNASRLDPYKNFKFRVNALSDLDANAAAVAFQHIKLENEGWERDTSVVEPKEP